MTATADSATERSRPGCRVLALDFTDPVALEALAAERFDAVLHCASSRGGGPDLYARVYRDGLRNLVERFRGAKVVFTGSTSVYAQTDGGIVDETSETRPERETGRVLLEAERMALDAGGVVLRLGGLYGPGRSAPIARYLAGSARLEEGGGRWMNQIHRDDAAAACLRAVGLPGGIYNVVDDRPATQREVYSWIAEYFGGELPPVGPADPARKRGLTSKRVSNARLRATGWKPAFPGYRDAIPVIAPTIVQGTGSS